MKYDIIVIGMGPAGMAVSAMGSAMGLDVLAVEKDKVGGECLNSGCIPSKALLKAGDAHFIAKNLAQFGIDSKLDTDISDSLGVVRNKIGRINDKKLMKAFEKVDLIIRKGSAKFIDKNTIEVDNKKYKGKYIFIATGTIPMIPPIPGLNEVPKLTNVNLFEQKEIPESLTIIGGGAIGSEMAQAFNNLGSKVTIVQLGDHLLPAGDKEAGNLLGEIFDKYGIKVVNNALINNVKKEKNEIIVNTNKGNFISKKILVAAGRKISLGKLKLENANVKFDKKSIIVDKYLRTSQKNIYAIGDCNGYAMFSHAAMHQGMLALMHAVSSMPLKMFNFKKYPVPWSVFTKPEVAQVGLTEHEAAEKNIKFEVVKYDFKSYGRTVADGKPEGFIKVITNSKGKIFGVSIIGESASELIQEWTVAIQHKLSLFDIMMTQHSFPTISMINKMIAENWMMKKMESGMLRKVFKKIV